MSNEIDQVFTLGNRSEYRQSLAKYGENTRKLGPRPAQDDKLPYAGGIAFPSVAVAKLWAKANGKGWVPFLLEGKWSDDVWWDNETICYRIKRDLRIIGEAE